MNICFGVFIKFLLDRKRTAARQFLFILMCRDIYIIHHEKRRIKTIHGEFIKKFHAVGLLTMPTKTIVPSTVIVHRNGRSSLMSSVSDGGIAPQYIIDV